MSTSLESNESDLLIENSSGDRLPFSKGIMATSLLATGITTEQAYKFASDIQKNLRAEPNSVIPANELPDIIKTILKEHPNGSKISERWMAWRAVKKTGRPIVIILLGAPGVGKSTFATRLAIRLGINRVVTSDAIREALRVVVPEVVSPELHRSTYELVDHTSSRPFAGFSRQRLTVSSAMAAVASRHSTELKSVIFEGVHLIPSTIKTSLEGHEANPIIVERLVVIPKSRHKANIRNRRSLEPLRKGEHRVRSFKSISSIYDHLLEESGQAGIENVNPFKSAKMTRDIVDEIISQVENY